jgi:hypothetical protein
VEDYRPGIVEWETLYGFVVKYEANGIEGNRMQHVADASQTTFRTAMAAVLLLLGCVGVAAGAMPIKIIAPLQNDVVHNNEGIMRVDVELDPAIDRAVRGVRILLDGKPAAPDALANSFTLEGVERGEHWLQALLIDAQGNTLQVSDTIFFTMWQASVNNPALKRRPP